MSLEDAYREKLQGFESEPIAYKFGQLEIRGYGTERKLGTPSSEQLESFDINLAERLHPSRMYKAEKKLSVAAIHIDGDGSFSQDLISQGSSIPKVTLALAHALTEGLTQLAKYIREHPESWLAHTDYFLGNSRLADVDQRLAESFGFRTFAFDNPHMGKETYSHRFATQAFIATGMNYDTAKEKASERTSKTAVISREALLERY